MDANSIIPAAVISTASLVNNAISSVKNAKELAKNSQDSDLKSAVGEALADVLELRIRLLELDEENRELRKQITQKATLKRDPQTGFYFKDGEPESPMCQKCYEGDGKLAYLGQPHLNQHLSRNSRYCHQCNNDYYE